MDCNRFEYVPTLQETLDAVGSEHPYSIPRHLVGLYRISGERPCSDLAGIDSSILNDLEEKNSRKGLAIAKPPESMQAQARQFKYVECLKCDKQGAMLVDGESFVCSQCGHSVSVEFITIIYPSYLRYAKPLHVRVVLGV